MGNSIIFAGISAGVIVIAVGMTFATMNQVNYIPDNAVPAKATLEGSFSNEGFSPVLNKEKWHEDPFGDIAAEVRKNAGV